MPRRAEADPPQLQTRGCEDREPLPLASRHPVRGRELVTAGADALITHVGDLATAVIHPAARPTPDVHSDAQSEVRGGTRNGAY